MERSLRPWDIFFSYSHRDEAMVSKYAGVWKALGIRIWYDQDPAESPVEMHSAVRVLDGVYNSHFFGLFYSEHSKESKHVPLEFRSYLKRPIDFWGLSQAGDVLVFTPGGDAGEAREFIESKDAFWFPDGGYQAEIFFLPSAATEPEIIELGRKLVTVLDGMHQYEEAPATHPNRADCGLAYWNWAKIHTLEQWQPNMPRILGAFERLVPPYDRWTPDLPQHLAAAIEERVSQIFHCHSHGANYVGLFCEALASVLMPRVASYTHDGSKFIDERTFHDIGSVGGLIDTLLSLSIEGNFIEGLQHAYYVARRAELTVPTRDALDLTVLFALGAMVVRWEDMTVTPSELVEKLVEQQRISFF